MAGERQPPEPNNNEGTESEASSQLSAKWPRLVIESIRDFAIVTLNLAGTIVAWNEGAEIMFGFRVDEAIGQHTRIIFTPEDRANHVPEQEMAKARATGRAEDERWHLRKDQSRFYVSGVMTLLHSDDNLNGEPIGYVKVARDLTERKQAEEALRQLNETLESRVQERTEQIRALVTELSMSEQAERRRVSQILHDDLQQRLYSVNFQLATLRYALNGGDRAIAQQTVDEIEAALNNAVQVTRNLSIDLSPPILHQEGLFEAIRWLAVHMNQQHGLTVTVESAESVPLPDDDLRVMLFQTVRELLFNVVKHAGVPAAQITLDYVNGQIQIQVSDGGRGFDTSAEREQNSQGLLRIQQRLQLMGGTLAVASAPGQGTRVTLYTPWRRAVQE